MNFLNKKIVILFIFLIGRAEAQDFTVEKWNVVEIELTSLVTYTDPFNDVDVSASFSGPNGVTIVRPAFWDGGQSWKIRFAPTEIGSWSMITLSTNVLDNGLHNISKSIQCNAYTGPHEIYQKGFLKIDSSNRYFVYDDGSPFFYLGDTHWTFIHERFDTSNKPGVPSQFKYTLDKRVSQGFTVYQTEAIQHPHSGGHTASDEEPHCNFRDGFDNNDLAGFENIDKKFKYIADNGLVNANSSLVWVTDPKDYATVYSEAYLSKLSKYWVARYGAYPVLWTIAQEVDNDYYGSFNSTIMDKWYSVAQAIEDNDAYEHPLSAHMEDSEGANGNNHTLASTSSWGSKSYHDWWAMQWQGFDGVELEETYIAKDFWNNTPTKPTILYEPPYDGFWTDTKGARGAAYKAFQYGMYGYGYGANGIWNDLYAIGDYGTAFQMPDNYLNWYDGANLPAGDQMTHFKNFYTSLDWWKLKPRFDDQTWGSFFDPARSIISSDDNETYVIYFFGPGTTTGTLKNLDNDYIYSAQWFNPRTGVYTDIPKFIPLSGEKTLPNRPDDQDWVMLVTKDSSTSSSLNLALHRSYASSTNWDTSQTAEKAFDENTSTNWQAVSGSTFNGQWLEVNFGEFTQFDNVKLSEYGNRTSGFKIEYSNDGTNWSTAYTGTTIGANSNISFDAVTGKYARIYFSSGTQTPIIYEFEVYLSQQQFSTTLRNLSFEEPVITTYQYGPFTDVWSFGSSAGIQRNGSSWGASNAPDGQQTAFLQSQNSLITQTLEITETGNYIIYFKAANRPSNSQKVRIYFDNTDLGIFEPSSTAFENFATTSFSVISGVHTIKFAGTESGDQTVFIDDISLKQMSANMTVSTSSSYSSSSDYDTSQTAEKAFDADLGTNWQSISNSGFNGEWLQVNFGSPTNFDTVHLSEYGNRVTGYRIEYSTDGTNWSTAYTGTTIGASLQISFPEVTGNYARIFFLSGTGATGVNQPIIYEFEIYEDPNIYPESENLALYETFDKKRDSFLKVYPNPARDKVYVEYNLSSEDNNTFYIYNLQGVLFKTFQVKQTHNNSKNKLDIDLSDLTPGIYFIKNNRNTFKLIKK
ncbi:DUF4038 domain-containing protein [Winogradskyella sp.]|uniref:apiosidase-like domain-containing protein n=1 Tax=Winogradskyella sp. TaxID=1883156 RepID=UPI003516C45E